MNTDIYDGMLLLESLSKIYISIHIFELKTDEYITIQSNEIIDGWAKDPVGAQAKTVNVLNHIAVPEYLESIINFTDFSSLDSRMKDTNTITMIFKGIVNGWCRARFIAVDYAEDGTLNRVMFTVECIHEEKERENYLTYLAQTDFLTEISNRGYGEHCINELIAAKTEGVFGLLDVDHFKAINDLYGHDIGDQVLVNIGHCLKKIQQPGDIIMRLGGDEFAFYLVGVKTKKEIKERIEILFLEIEKISHHIPILNEDISISLGVSFYSDTATFDKLYKKADYGVYASKRRRGSALTFDH